jgi:SAM-dependent methyltransferase
MGEDAPVPGLFSGDATAMAEFYERTLVPGVFTPWGRDLVQRVGVKPGQRALDVAAGTGAVTATLAEVVGPEGHVEALDLAPGMIAHLEKKNLPNVSTQVGDATALPFPDESFDIAVCQQGIQFVPEWRTALAEMYRTLRPTGRLGVACWAPLEEQVTFVSMFDVAEKHGFDHLLAPMRVPVSMVPAELAEAVSALGARDVDVARVEMPTFTPDEWLDGMFDVPPLGPAFADVPADTKAAIKDDLRSAMSAWAVDGGTRAPWVSTVVTATR